MAFLGKFLLFGFPRGLAATGFQNSFCVLFWHFYKVIKYFSIFEE
jgi:hypothetical protein